MERRRFVDEKWLCERGFDQRAWNKTEGRGDYNYADRLREKKGGDEKQKEKELFLSLFKKELRTKK